MTDPEISGIRADDPAPEPPRPQYEPGPDEPPVDQAGDPADEPEEDTP